MEKLLESHESPVKNKFNFEIATHNENSVVIKGEDELKNLIKNNKIVFDERFELKVEASVLKLAYTNNKLLSLSNSRTRILAHQVESTHRIINSLNYRFLLADEVGLGKTIEAGLVIKELIFRSGYERILIVCPASLVFQWQNELQSKFNESFVIMDRHALKSHLKKKNGHNPNPWHACGKIICSLDFIKSASHKEELLNTKWDIIVIDEAHRLRRDDLKTTLAYNVAEVLSVNTSALLLLSATPFRGKLEELYFLINLLDKNLLGPFQTFYNTYCLNDCDLTTLRQKLTSVTIRRTKKEIGGFTKRHAKTIRFEFFQEERILYDATTRYVIEEYNKAIQTENRAVGFVMTVFQKLLDSSSMALLSALKKRRAHLLYLVEGENEEIIKNKLIEKKLILDFNEIDDSEDIDDVVDQSIKKTIQEIKEEILILENLIKIAESITRNKKGEKLNEIIIKLKKRRCKKILIFTQFRTTQEYLKDLLQDYRIELFNGSMSKNEKEEAILNFKERADILISTEAGGEGRNLQFCNIIINYDLPWSPLKIEQRIGRIHRFGQPDDVYIYNFSTKDTVAERILSVLTKKLRLFEESIGTPDILLGQIEEEINLDAIFMKMAATSNNRKIYSEIDSKLKAARESYEKLNELAVARKMDFNYDEYYKITLRDREYSNRRIENFINSLRNNYKPVDRYIGRKSRITRLYSIKEFPDGEKPEKKHGTFDSARALDNENLEFLAFGNSIVDTLVNMCHKEDFGGSTGIKIIKYNKKISGMIFYYIVTFNSISRQKELMPVFVPAGILLSDNEVSEIELKSIESPAGIKNKKNNYDAYILKIQKDADKFFDLAYGRIIRKADMKIREMSSILDSSIRPEIEKISDSYVKKIKEYEEQLERQICQMKWYNKDMKSAITRTRNKISNEMIEKEDMLSKYNNYLHVDYTIEILSAGILIALP